MSFPFNDVSLPVDERVNDLISRLTLSEKIGFMPTIQLSVKRLGIKPFKIFGEAAHGIVDRTGVKTTVLPQTIGLASTWNKDTLHECGECVGDEARGYYKIKNEYEGLIMFSPTIDLLRDPRWGRTEEGYSEDPYLTGKLSAEYIKGLQGTDDKYYKMICTAKHFYANNNEYDRAADSATVDERSKHEYYLIPFEYAFLDGKAGGIMCAYNSINGVPSLQSSDIADTIRGIYGFTGFVLSDGEGLKTNVCYTKYAKSYTVAFADAVKAGIDCFTEMPELVMDSAEEAIRRGLLTEADIENAIRKTITARMKLGHFDEKIVDPYVNISSDVIGCDKHRKEALKVTEESVVLLKNNGILPLDANKVNKVGIIGPCAEKLFRDWYTGNPNYSVSPLDGIINRVGKDKVLFHSGMDRLAFRHKKTGKYLTVDEADGNKVKAAADTAGKNETFEIIDWGYGAKIFKSEANGKYVTDNGTFKATSTDWYNWFVDEKLAIVKIDEGFHIKNTHGGDTGINALGEMTSDISKCVTKKIINNEVDGTQNMVVSESEAKEGVFEPEADAVYEEIVMESGIAEAVKIAAESDVVIFTAGISPLINGRETHDRPSLNLPAYQEKLIESVFAANPNTVLVLVTGYPFASNREEETLPAILTVTHGACDLGTALAGAVFGDYSPAGRLTMTWHHDDAMLPPMYEFDAERGRRVEDYNIISGKRTYQYFEGDVLYPFGHGLSYTTFEYSNLRLSAKEISKGETIKVSFDVKNVGKFDSDEVPQMYISVKESSVKRPIRQLKGFTRLFIKSGETKTVEFELPYHELKFWSVVLKKYMIEKGSCEISVGASSGDLRLHDTIKVNGEELPFRTFKRRTRASDFDDCGGIFLDKGEDGTCVCSKGEGFIRFNKVKLRKEIRVYVTASSDRGENGEIEFCIDSPDNHACSMPVDTNGRDNWQSDVTGGGIPEGVHDVIIKLHGKVNIDHFLFGAEQYKEDE